MDQPRLTIRTPVFEGPLELLLTLAEQDQVDLMAIRVSDLTSGYLEALSRLQGVDAAEMAEFLDLAARLLLLKSIRLMPADEAQEDFPEEDLVDWEEDVRARLLQYQAYRRMAEAMMERAQQEAFSFPPPVRPIPSAGQEEPIAMASLLGAFEGLLRRLPPPALLVATEPWTMPERVSYLEARLQAGGFDLVDVIQECVDRLQAVVTFVALLELWRQGRVVVRQRSSFGQIWVEGA